MTVLEFINGIKCIITNRNARIASNKAKGGGRATCLFEARWNDKNWLLFLAGLTEPGFRRSRAALGRKGLNVEIL